MPRKAAEWSINMIEKSNSFAKEGLHALLAQNGDAQDYFKSLPDYVRDMIEDRAQSVQSVDELHRYAENLLAGDK